MGLEGIHLQPLKFIVGFAQYDRPTLPWLTQHADTERLLRRYCNFTTPVRYCHCARKLWMSRRLTEDRLAARVAVTFSQL